MRIPKKIQNKIYILCLSIIIFVILNFNNYNNYNNVLNRTSIDNQYKYVFNVSSISSNIYSNVCKELYTLEEFRIIGVVYYGDYKYTWYDDTTLDGGGLVIKGRHYDEQGYICDEQGYICVASSELDKGTIVYTPFGKQGKVYDSGCPFGVIDVYIKGY